MEEETPVLSDDITCKLKGENADEKNADGEMVETEVTVEEDGEESTAEAVDEKEILDDYSIGQRWKCGNTWS